MPNQCTMFAAYAPHRQGGYSMATVITDTLLS